MTEHKRMFFRVHPDERIPERWWVIVDRMPRWLTRQLEADLDASEPEPMSDEEIDRLLDMALKDGAE